MFSPCVDNPTGAQMHRIVWILLLFACTPTSEREGERERERDRQTDRQTDRHRHGQRERERERRGGGTE